MRSDESAGHRANQQCHDQCGVDVAQAEVQQSCDSCEHYCVYYVCANVYLGRIAIEEQQKHHDDAARADRSHAHEEPCKQADYNHPGK